ncbi:MAG: MBL fold metallo-hydrolase [Proteobacteria bacterium]|nr:MBL fold metallo-hydrolase [Sideroxydans sp.]MBU4152319.1 MBL fold metallo-hydrolase [Pseudomonadota bacterium]
MRFCVLGSGSKGNCTYVETGGVALLIDVGFSGIEVGRRLENAGLDIGKVAGILVTHEHTDHVSGVGVLSRKYRLPVYANTGTKVAAGGALDKLHAFVPFSTGTSFLIPPFTIHPFAISHDTADPVGFTIDDGEGTLGYCTDTGMVSRLIHHHLRRCHGLILECNHDLELLKQGPYPPALQQRIRSKNGHLANPEAMAFVGEVLHSQLRHVVLAHISDKNNCRDRIRIEVEQSGVTGPEFSLCHQEKAGQVITIP